MAPKQTEPNNPHDALFRSTFSQVEHAAAEFRAVLPSELLSAVNLTTLRLESGTFVDAELSSSHSVASPTNSCANERWAHCRLSPCGRSVMLGSQGVCSRRSNAGPP